jgi:hypothetical protein
VAEVGGTLVGTGRAGRAAASEWGSSRRMRPGSPTSGLRG